MGSKSMELRFAVLEADGTPLLFVIVPRKFPISAILGEYQKRHFYPPREHPRYVHGNIIEFYSRLFSELAFCCANQVVLSLTS